MGQKIKTTIYWDSDLRDEINRIAKDHNRSLNGEVEWALRQHAQANEEPREAQKRRPQ